MKLATHFDICLRFTTLTWMSRVVRRVEYGCAALDLSAGVPARPRADNDRAHGARKNTANRTATAEAAKMRAETLAFRFPLKEFVNSADPVHRRGRTETPEGNRLPRPLAAAVSLVDHITSKHREAARTTLKRGIETASAHEWDRHSRAALR